MKNNDIEEFVDKMRSQNKTFILLVDEGEEVSMSLCGKVCDIANLLSDSATIDEDVLSVVAKSNSNLRKVLGGIPTVKEMNIKDC